MKTASKRLPSVKVYAVVVTLPTGARCVALTDFGLALFRDPSKARVIAGCDKRAAVVPMRMTPTEVA